MKERTPAKPFENSRDLNGFMTDQVKSMHKRSLTLPGKGPRDQRQRPGADPISLKQFAKALIAKGGEEAAAATRWIANKRANFSKPPLGLGSTRKKKNKDGKKP